MGGDAERQPLSPGAAPRASGCCQGYCLNHIVAIARIVGFLVVVEMWAATVTTLKEQVAAPAWLKYYLLGASIIVTFFEITWIMDKMVCCVRQGCCCKFWACLVWVDGWRKLVLYGALSVPLFLQGLDGLLHVLTGFCLLAAACLYLVTSFQGCVQPSPSASYAPVAPAAPPPALVATYVQSATQTDVINMEAGTDVTNGSLPRGGEESGAGGGAEDGGKAGEEKGKGEDVKTEEEKGAGKEKTKGKAANEKEDKGKVGETMTSAGKNPFEFDSEEEAREGDADFDGGLDIKDNAKK